MTLLVERIPRRVWAAQRDSVTSSTHASAEAVKGWADATRHSHALVAASRHASSESEGRARINVLRGV